MEKEVKLHHSLISLDKIKPGEYVKVLIPGERPWVKVLEVGEGGFVGKIDNKLTADLTEEELAEFSEHFFGQSEPLPRLHNYRMGDELTFIDGGRGWFEPLEQSAKH